MLKHSYHEMTSGWDDMHHYSPAPRYRRRVMINYLKTISFNDCLDVGCAQGYLIQEIVHRFHVRGYGMDVSTTVINENKKKIPECEFRVVDLEKSVWADDRQFDVVISTEVIEHIDNWKNAVKHLASMARHHLLITVPGGPVRPMDKKVGHFRHFTGHELKAEIESYGFTCTTQRIGFPFHSLYKRLINYLNSERIYDQFSGQKNYTILHKFISHGLYYLFYINDLFHRGEQLIIFARR